MASEPDEPGESEGAGSPRGDLGPPGSAPAAWGLIGIGFEFLATICVMGAIGWYLDRRWNTFPWLLIAGCAVGFAGGLMMMIRAARQAFKD
ncbi:MAG TPA: AtpZ/AtpI family protein [Tepidisphaeraceae bacterium]|nr:AtpZ/AtpI family protein [Tepidisphaeraceae bacterium]